MLCATLCTTACGGSSKAWLGDGRAVDVELELVVDGALVLPGEATRLRADTVHTFLAYATPVGGALPPDSVLWVEVPGTFPTPQVTGERAEAYTTAYGPSGPLPVDVTVVLETDHRLGDERSVISVALPDGLPAGRTVQITYGDTEHGSFGARASKLAPRRFALGVGALSDSDSVVRAGSFPVETYAAEPAEIRVYGPSQSRPGQRVGIRASAFDHLGNPALGVDEPVVCDWVQNGRAVPAGEVRLDRVRGGGATRGRRSTTPLSGGVWYLQCAHPTLPVHGAGATRVEDPAVRRPLAIEPPPDEEDTGDTGDTGFIDSGSMVLLWGDVHVHSTVSGDAEGSTSVADSYDYARFTAGLDFASVSDHDANPGTLDDTSIPDTGDDEHPPLWLDAIAAANDHNDTSGDTTDTSEDSGRFLTLLGWEYTVPKSQDIKHGHKIVYYLQGTVAGGWAYVEDTAAGTVSSLFSYGNPDYETNCQLWSALQSQDASSSPRIRAFTVPHHTAAADAPSPTDWGVSVPEDCDTAAPRSIQPLVEIYSEHGSSEGWDGSQPDTGYFDPVECTAIDTGKTMQAAQEYRWGDAGTSSHFLGILASSDSHYGRPGHDPIPVDKSNPNNDWSYAGVGANCHPSAGGIRFREAGLAGVWVKADSAANAHKRDKLWRWMRRRRTFGTTGERMTVKLSMIHEEDPGPTTTVVDQGGWWSGFDIDEPEYAVTGASEDQTVKLRLEVCPESLGHELEEVQLIHGYDDGGWTWEELTSWGTGDFDGSGCLPDTTLTLIDAGVESTYSDDDVADGENVYYLRVHGEERESIVITSGSNDLLRIGSSKLDQVSCTLSTTSSDGEDPTMYAATLETNLDTRGGSLTNQRWFEVGFAASFFEIEAFSCAAKNAGCQAGFFLNGEYSVRVARTMSELGFVRTTYTAFPGTVLQSSDEVQEDVNVEFAWSSPVWLRWEPT